uniref:RanBD1 domain-containing protein n=1 Tax=Ciona intestinalis TaxID=7719 RepID=H2XM76_CIOIN
SKTFGVNVNKLVYIQLPLKGLHFGKLWYKAGDYNSAAQWIVKYLKTFDRDTSAHKLLGDCYEKLSEIEAALSCFKRSLQIKPNQPELLLHIVELYLNPGPAQNPNKAQIWLDKAAASLPGNATVFKMKMELMLAQQASPSVLEKAILQELKRRSNDPALHVQYVSFMRTQDRLEDAYAYCVKIENILDSASIRSDYKWSSCVVSTYKEHTEKLQNNQQHSHHIAQLMLLEALSRFIWVCLEDNKQQKALEKLQMMDECLSSVLSNKAIGDWKVLAAEMEAQLCWLAATFLIQQAAKNEKPWGEASDLAAVLFSSSVSKSIPSSSCAWSMHCLNHQPYLPSRVQRNAAQRLSQSSHMMWILSAQGEEGWIAKLRENLDQSTVGLAVFQSLFHNTNSSSSYLCNTTSLASVACFIPTVDEMMAYDNVASASCKLDMLIWLGIRWMKMDMTVDFLHWVKSSFPNLQMVTSNSSAGYQWISLSLLDIEAFIAACVYTTEKKAQHWESAATLNHRQLSSTTLPLPLCRKLTTDLQNKWWSAAVKLSNKKNVTAEEAGKLKPILQRGLECLRGVGNHGLEVVLITKLANTLNKSNRHIYSCISTLNNSNIHVYSYISTLTKLLKKTNILYSLQHSFNCIEVHKTNIEWVDIISQLEDKHSSRAISAADVTPTKDFQFLGNFVNLKQGMLVEYWIQVLVIFKVSTGEENEDVLFQERLSCYHFYVWKSRILLDLSLPALSVTTKKFPNPPYLEIWLEQFKLVLVELAEDKDEGNFLFKCTAKVKHVNSKVKIISTLPVLIFKHFLKTPAIFDKNFNYLYKKNCVNFIFTGANTNAASNASAFKFGVPTSTTAPQMCGILNTYQKKQFFSYKKYTVNTPFYNAKNPSRNNMLKHKKIGNTPQTTTDQKFSFKFGGDLSKPAASSKFQFGSPQPTDNKPFSQEPVKEHTALQRTGQTPTNSSFSFKLANSNNSTGFKGLGFYKKTPNFSNLKKSSISNEQVYGSKSNFFKHRLNNYLKDGEEADSEGEKEEEERDIHVEPIAKLPDLVTVVTGEEGERTIYSQRSKLFRWDKTLKQWKERGLGDICIKHNQENGKFRIVMRREQVFKVCANHYITSKMKLTPMPDSDRTWTWIAADFADGEETEIENFAIKFKTCELANLFKEKFEECQVLIDDTNATTTSAFQETTTDLINQAEKMKSELDFFKDKLSVKQKIDLENTLTEGKSANLKLIFLFKKNFKPENFFPPTDDKQADKENVEVTRDTYTGSRFYMYTLLSNIINFKTGRTRNTSISLSKFEFNMKVDPTMPEHGSHKTRNIHSTEEADIHVEPIVPLPDKVDVPTGEEQDQVLFENRVKLFVFHRESKQWKERGLGRVRILQNLNNYRIRLVMRREQVFKVCLNHFITEAIHFNFKENSDKVLVWAATDFSDPDK